MWCRGYLLPECLKLVQFPRLGFLCRDIQVNTLFLIYLSLLKYVDSVNQFFQLACYLIERSDRFVDFEIHRLQNLADVQHLQLNL